MTNTQPPFTSMTNWQRAKIDIARLEAANAQLVKQYGELQRKYMIVSTLMRRFARIRTLQRWSERYAGHQPGFARDRTMEEHDRMVMALIDKPWEAVIDL